MIKKMFNKSKDPQNIQQDIISASGIKTCLQGIYLTNASLLTKTTSHTIPCLI